MISLSLKVLLPAVLLTLAGPLREPQPEPAQAPAVLDGSKLRQYVGYFNRMEPEEVKNYVPNDQASDWLAKNVPLFECPDSVLERTYYYRWWTFRKHLKQTPDGFIFTEFITPVGHQGKHGSISCALGHHIYEGRWLHDPQYIDQYTRFWFTGDKQQAKPRFHQFSSWVGDAAYNRYLVNQDKTFLLSLLDDLQADFQAWETEKSLGNGLYWQFDVRDGMEESMSGSRREKNARPTINSYMYGYAKALSRIATLAGKPELARQYDAKAAQIKSTVLSKLWDEEGSFFKTRLEKGPLAEAREAIGFIPWYFGLPDDKAAYGKAWEQIADSQGFASPWGLTTAERRNPTFQTRGSGHGCEWDGPVWPFASTQTLKGLANLLNNYKQHDMTKKHYYDALRTYAWAHQKNGKPYIGEYQDETTGYWLKGDNPRSSYYNHSGFCDLVINDLVGLKPREDNTIEVKPLVPEGHWDWFALDNVLYHNRVLTIIWDKTGRKYGKGKGFRIFADGKQIYHSRKLAPAKAKLPG